jgi:hypothetical protein
MHDDDDDGEPTLLIGQRTRYDPSIERRFPARELRDVVRRVQGFRR